MQVNAANLARLNEMVNIRFNAGLERKITDAGFMSMEIPSVTAQNIYPYLKHLARIREWIGDREIQNVSAGSFTVVNKTYEETVGISREAVDDDTYGIYMLESEQMGQDVAAFRSAQSFGLLKLGNTTIGPDGQFFFDTDHPVGSGVVANDMGGAGTAWYIVDASKVFKPVIWQPRREFTLTKLFNLDDPNVFFQNKFVWGVDGRSAVAFSPFWQLAFRSRQTLDATNLKAALTAMSVQKNDTGQPLNTKATHLVVDPSQQELANDLIGKEYIAGGESNTLRGRLTVVSAGELL